MTTSTTTAATFTAIAGHYAIVSYMGLQIGGRMSEDGTKLYRKATRKGVYLSIADDTILLQSAKKRADINMTKPSGTTHN